VEHKSIGDIEKGIGEDITRQLKKDQHSLNLFESIISIYHFAK
jgi:hypothetical protein